MRALGLLLLSVPSRSGIYEIAASAIRRLLLGEGGAVSFYTPIRDESASSKILMDAIYL
jgi:hypothetical protein